MCSNNTRDPKIKGRLIRSVFDIECYETIDSMCFTIRKVKLLKGITSRRGRNTVDWMLVSIHFPRGPSMYTLSADWVHSSSFNRFENRIDNYLARARYR